MTQKQYSEEELEKALAQWGEDAATIFHDLGEALSKFMIELGKALQPVLDSFIAFYAQIEMPYIEAGRPYGNTPEGMVKWYKEQMESSPDEADPRS